MKQERITKVPPKEAESQAVDEVAVEGGDTALLTDIDELLDEIDAVLEDQAVLVGFRQRSGQ
jgi:hypothetical protein